tara:strand:- start:4753 stop:5109 length:357 start_codon:yes stop_codon:yes gene_type:complete
MKLICSECDLVIESANTKTCPKCDAPLRARSNGRLMHVDVAHSGENLDQALRKLERAIDEAVHHNFRGIKVIHGRGATTGKSFLKPHIVNAMKRAATLYGGKVAPDRDNAGAHLLWLE